MLWTMGLSLALVQDFVETDTTVLWTVQGSKGGQLGWAVSALADLDGDGALEVIAGAPFADKSAGNVRIYSGASGVELLSLSAEGTGQLGFAVADAGDMNGDGLHEILVGAPATSTGEALVFSGADGALLHRSMGENLGDNAGLAVSGAGDLNGDGQADFAVAEPGWSKIRGRVRVFSGADGSLLRTLEGESRGDQFGSGLAQAGDLNGDGLSELLVGARHAGLSGGGRVYAFSGADGALLLPPLSAEDSVDLGYFFLGDVGDLDLDGTPDLYAGDFSSAGGTGDAYVFSGHSGAVLLHLIGGHPGEGLGCGRGAGDLDGDGVPDLTLGSWSDDSEGSDAGRVQTFSGATGVALRSFTNRGAGDNFGFDTVGVGDVNGDGGIDIVASAATGGWLTVIAGIPPEPPLDTGEPTDEPEPAGGCRGGAALLLLPFLLRRSKSR